MTKKYTCIVCPNGCEISVDLEMDEIIDIRGAACKRGKEYAEQELKNPMRTIASSVAVKQGILPLASVRVNKPIPKDKIFEVMNEIKKIQILAPVSVGDVVIADVLGLGSDVIITKNIEKNK